MRGLVLLALLTLAGCGTIDQGPTSLAGEWGGRHIALTIDGAAGTIEYDCASGTIDSLIFSDSGGRFTGTGRHRAGEGGPERVGQILPSVGATYSGQVGGNSMTLAVALADGSSLGPFRLTLGAVPLITRCL